VKELADSRILIVDDVKTNVDILVQALRNDYKLSVALDGAAALTNAEKTPPDLVLLDIMMPGLDGYEVCRRLRADTKTSFLPVVMLSYDGFAGLSRYMRASMLDVMGQDFVQMARAKGLAERVVVFKHVVRNSLIPQVTILASILPGLIGGSIIIETIFSIPGLGQLGYESVLARDYPTVMALFTVSALLTLLGILISDLLLAVVDPRIAFGRRQQ